MGKTIVTIFDQLSDLSDNLARSNANLEAMQEHSGIIAALILVAIGLLFVIAFHVSKK